LTDALDRAGVEGLARRVVQRFLAGVVLEAEGQTSNAFVLLLARMFVLGVPGLPVGGMQMLPEMLAAPIRDRVRLLRRARHVRAEGAGWTVTDGDITVGCRHVVVAADPVGAAALTGAPPPVTRGVVTDWWATDEPPPGPAMVSVDGRAQPSGPVLNAAVVSKAAPSYAPAGRHLIAASALIVGGHDAPPETVMRRHAGDILGADATRWTPVTRHVVPHALPAQPSPLKARRSIRTPEGLWVCGDHRDTASIQGAMVSGRRVAEAISGAG
jgi:hypothetical protein